MTKEEILERISNKAIIGFKDEEHTQPVYEREVAVGALAELLTEMMEKIDKE